MQQIKQLPVTFMKQLHKKHSMQQIKQHPVTFLKHKNNMQQIKQLPVTLSQIVAQKTFYATNKQTPVTFYKNVSYNVLLGSLRSPTKTAKYAYVTHFQASAASHIHVLYKTNSCKNAVQKTFYATIKTNSCNFL
jgi:hypothetical protein